MYIIFKTELKVCAYTSYQASIIIAMVFNNYSHRTEPWVSILPKDWFLHQRFSTEPDIKYSLPIYLNTFPERNSFSFYNKLLRRDAVRHDVKL